MASLPPVAVRAPDGRLVSAPEAALPKATAAAVRAATQLTLSGAGIEELVGFERFVNLSVLWVNDNALRAVTGLDANFRLKVLHAHNNAITTLAGSLAALVFLEELNLANNSLVHLDRCLDTLAGLRNLKVLWLHHNPVAQEVGYRGRVIAALPQLTMLDNHVVTPAERRAADAATLARAGRRSLGASVSGAPHAASRLSAAATAATAAGAAAATTGGGGGKGGVARSVTHRWLAAEVAAIQAARRAAERRALTGAFEAHIDPAWAAASRRGTGPDDGPPPLPSALVRTVADLSVDDAADRAILSHMAARGVRAALPPPPAAASLPCATLPGGTTALGATGTLRATARSGAAPAATDAPPLRAALSASLLRAAPRGGDDDGSRRGSSSGGGLGHWDRYRIRQVFAAMCRPGEDALDRDALTAALEACADVGVRAVPPARSLAAYVDAVADAMTAPGSNDRIRWLDFVIATETGTYTKGMPPPPPPAAAATAATAAPTAATAAAGSKGAAGGGGAPPPGTVAAGAKGGSSRPGSAVVTSAGDAAATAAAAASAKAKAPTIVRVSTLDWVPLTAAEARSRSERHATNAAAMLDRAQRLIAGDPEVAQLTSMAVAATEKANYLTHVADSLDGVLDPEAPPPPVPRPRVDYYATTVLRGAAAPRKRGTAPPPRLTTTLLRVALE